MKKLTWNTDTVETVSSDSVECPAITVDHAALARLRAEYMASLPWWRRVLMRLRVVRW